MKVFVANERREELENSDIEFVKKMEGINTADEIINTFRNFYYSKMVLDVTGIKDYLNISNIQKLAMNLNVGKIIFFLPNIPEVSSSTYLSKLVGLGIYNFTNNLEGVKYLLNHENTREDVKYVDDMMPEVRPAVSNVKDGKVVLGFKNITDHAGATTLIYLMKKELERTYDDKVYAIEVSRHDFEYFNIENAISTNAVGLKTAIDKLENIKIVLVDLNDCKDYSMCSQVIYLVEPTTIQLNKLMRTNKNIFRSIEGETLLLNKSLLSEKDVGEFEYESRSKVFFNVPPLDERKRSEEITNLVIKLGLLGEKAEEKSQRLFGIFKV